jgi:anaerobic magnesium-protoporphyrin IX monomethyl ester cyclase
LFQKKINEGIMKGLFLNLPYKNKIVRRYNCSYNSPTFLLQPIELISLAGIFRDWHGGQAFLIDAIAENKNIKKVCKSIEEINPEFIVCICGVEYFEEDMISVSHIKQLFPDIKIILFGHYATEFHEIILEKVNVDFIIHGEPDIVFSELIQNYNNPTALRSIKGLSFRSIEGIVHQKGSQRIPNPNELPMPAYDLLKNEYYSEPLFPKPYGIIQSARGCPYQCNYCITTFGSKLTTLTPENIVAQLEKQIELFEIKSFRFIDDTFTVSPARVISFCKLLIEKQYRLTWSCFSRSDTLDKEMLRYMKEAGCTRLYIGMESGSKKVLKFYNKNLNLVEAEQDISFCKETGFELIGLFMVGAPIETMEDVKESISFAKKARFDFVNIFQLVPYPGTQLFNTLKEEIDFSILPYKNQFKNKLVHENANKYQKFFFREFYFKKNKIGFILKNYLQNFYKEIFSNSTTFLKFMYFNSKEKRRKDFI